MRALLRFLAASPGELVLINLEDLWLEKRPQNTPGTYLERPNWQRKARYSFEEFSQMADVVEALDEVHRRRAEVLEPARSTGGS
jgi:4-alpha-glucanotransferase